MSFLPIPHYKREVNSKKKKVCKHIHTHTHTKPVMSSELWLVLTNVSDALAGVAQWTGCQPANQRGADFPSPVRAQAWVAGWGPGGGHVRGNYTLISLFLSPSLPFSLKINK